MKGGRVVSGVILSVDEFLRKFKPGDVFWYMVRHRGEAPSRVEGPCKIMGIACSYEGKLAPPVVTFTCQPYLRKIGNEEVRTMFVSDLVANRGAFESEKDARAYLRERQAAYGVDADLAAQLQRENQSREQSIEMRWENEWLPLNSIS